ncbi:alpha/beta hydrolase [Lysobacter sp. A3-1-A15]|uniref:alpha/beta hydrolase n=1 Tax=Novilysobacter viscosus TaxID=3098602 RepID=UPI002ED7F309
MSSVRNVLTHSALALTALLTTGCESALFAFANRNVAPPEVSVTYAPDLGLALDVYRPQGPQPGNAPAPTVVFFYGGGWQRGERAQYRFIGRRLAQNGILAIVADYRTFPTAGFPAFVDDAARAVAWTRDNAHEHGGDPGRLFVAGHSAGAQIAALVGTDARYLERQGMKPGDLAGVIGLAGPYDFEITGQYRQVFGPIAQWPQAQAINFVDGRSPPFLLIHGTGDRVVEARDSRQMDDKLTGAGVRSELLMLADAGHSAPLLALYDPGRLPQVLDAIVGFVARTPPPPAQ